MERASILPLLALCWLFFPLLASAQNGYVTVTATIPGYAGGQATANFVNQSTAAQLPLLSGSIFAQTAVQNLDVNGTFTLQLADNLLVQPTPSQWQIIVCARSGNAGQPCVPVALTITCVNNASCVNGVLDISSSFNLAPSPNLAGYVNAASVNGVVNVTRYGASGADLSARVAAAAAGCPADIGCTLFVPAGKYSFGSTIKLPAFANGITLQLDHAAVLTYTGSGAAIETPVAVSSGNAYGTHIQGGVLIGNPNATAGVHVQASNGVSVQQMSIVGFTGGDGVWLDGANHAKVEDNRLQGNYNDIQLSGNMCTAANVCQYTRSVGEQWNSSFLSGATGYAPNNDEIAFNVIEGAIAWGGIEDAVIGGSVTAAFGNDWHDNDFEANGQTLANPVNGLYLTYGQLVTCFSENTVIEHNYFEGNGRGIVEGCAGDAGIVQPVGYTGTFGGTAVQPQVVGNFFDLAAPIEIEWEAAASPIVSGNSENNHNGLTACFIDQESVAPPYTLGPNATLGSNRYGCLNAMASLAAAPATNPLSYAPAVALMAPLAMGGNPPLPSALSSGLGIPFLDLPGGGQLLYFNGDPGGSCGQPGANNLVFGFSATGFSECYYGAWAQMVPVIGGNASVPGNITAGGSVNAAHIVAAGVTNAAGMQVVSVPGCTIGSGAVGNNCTLTITLPVAEADINYHPICSAGYTNGNTVVAGFTNKTTTSFQTTEVALSTTATGGGYVDCIVAHN